MAEDLGLGFFKEWAYLAQYEDVVEAKEHFFIAWERGLKDALAGQELGPIPANYMLQGLRRERSTSRCASSPRSNGTGYRHGSRATTASARAPHGGVSVAAVRIYNSSPMARGGIKVTTVDET